MIAAANEIGSKRERSESGERRGEGRTPRMGFRALRRRNGKPAYAGDDRGHAGQLVPPDALAEEPHCQAKQDDEPESERRLDERERREEQCERLQRPAERAEAEGREPARSAHEASKQRGPEAMAARHSSRLECLQSKLGAVEARGQKSAADSGKQFGH